MPVSPIWERVEMLKGGKPLAGFCREVGLNYTAFKKSALRQSAPDSQSLEKIAKHFRADLHWLITGKTASSKTVTRIARRLKQYRKTRAWTLEEMAEKLAMNAQVLEFYEKGLWELSLTLINDLAKLLNVLPQQLLIDDTPKTPELKSFQASSVKNAPKLREDDYVSIPLTESSIAAGEPIIQENNIEDYVLLHIRAAGKRTNLVASRVDGESMEPMLHSGDIIVIDRDDKRVVKNKMYAVFYNEGLTAKYIERQNNLLILRPVNTSAQIQVVNLNENPDPVVGRIIGAWKEL